MSGWIAIALSVGGSVIIAAIAWGVYTTTVRALKDQVAELTRDVRALTASVGKLTTLVAVLRDRTEQQTGRHLASPMPPEPS